MKTNPIFSFCLIGAMICSTALASEQEGKTPDEQTSTPSAIESGKSPKAVGLCQLLGWVEQ